MLAFQNGSNLPYVWVGVIHTFRPLLDIAGLIFTATFVLAEYRQPMATAISRAPASRVQFVPWCRELSRPLHFALHCGMRQASIREKRANCGLNLYAERWPSGLRRWS